VSNKKLVGFALLGLGAVLIYFGYTAAQSFESQFRQAWSGSMSDKAMWYYTAGAVSAAVGAFLAFAGKR
jgi:hypothetical protein